MLSDCGSAGWFLTKCCSSSAEEVSLALQTGHRYVAAAGTTDTASGETQAVEPFSGVKTHMEMDMDWKWMDMWHNL